jgi:hypothetical protein
MRLSVTTRSVLALLLAVCAVLAGGAARIVQDQCGPFTDVTPTFCPYILELYYLGITAGTSATTYSPDDPLTRGQAAVFVAKGLNQFLARSSRYAALGQWWTTTGTRSLGLTNVGEQPNHPVADGQDIWVPNGAGYVSRVRASDGRIVETWTNTTLATNAIVAMGRVFVTGGDSLYMIDPSQAAGDAVILASGLQGAYGIAFDGSRIWTTSGVPGFISIFQPSDWSHIDVSGFSSPRDLVFDGTNMWLTENSGLLRLDSNGGIVQTVSIGFPLGRPVFDGINIWVPQQIPDFLWVVRASSGAVVAQLAGNGLNAAYGTAFDGQRVLVANANVDDTHVSLWNAADLRPLGSVDVGALAYGVCSDGINFWLTLPTAGLLARF